MYEGKEYEMRDTYFPTIDPADPYRLTEEERELVDKIQYSFMNSEKLKKHMRLSVYLWRNVSGLQLEPAVSRVDAVECRWQLQACNHSGQRILGQETVG